MTEPKHDAPAADDGEPNTVFIANLDADAVYWGVIEKHRDDLTDKDVEVPKDCDLAHGKYRWNPAAQPSACFEPLPRHQQKATQTAPSVERALHDLIVNPDDHKVATEWAKWFEKSMDAR